MAEKQPITFEALLPVLAETMKFSTQALAQSGAIADVLIAKGIVTKAELDANMGEGQKLRDKLMALLNEQAKTQS